jgi:purine-binding chemotaxis protein CheW
MLTRQLCTFYLDAHVFGIDVVRVQEVIRYQEMTRVPRAPKEVSGLINLRGQIVSAVDMRRRMGMPPRADGQLPMNVVVRTQEGPVSLLVDEIGDVLEVDEGTVERPPDTLSGRAKDLVRCVYKLEKGLLLVLDPEQVVTLN